MTSILHINDLYDKSSRQPFGFVGLDVKTKELKYLAFGDSNPRVLQEINPSTIKPRSRLWYHMQNCDFVTELYDPNLPPVLKAFTSKAISYHRRFNERRNLPTTYLEHNSPTLRAIYNPSISLDNATYDAVENLMELPVSNILWENLSFKQRAYIKSSIVHELGHMKVSKWEISPSGKTIVFQNGFSEGFYELEKIETLSNDIIYKRIILPREYKHTPEDAVDEILNDYECSFIQFGYQASYPKLGRVLNNLCDGQLLMARYNADLDVLRQSLYDIDPSYDLIEDLLNSLTEGTFGEESEQDEQNARRILKYYQKKKVK